MQESAELINFAAHDDVRARVLFQIALVLLDLLLEGFGLSGQFLDLVAQFEHSEELLFLCELSLLLNAAL